MSSKSNAILFDNYLNNRKFLLLVFFLGYLVAVKGQNFDLCWPLGWVNQNNVNLVFDNGTVRLDSTIRKAGFNAISTSISDSLGNLLFYTNGCFVGNNLNDTLLNGEELAPTTCQSYVCSNFGSSIPHGCLILPNRLNSNLFLLIHESCNYSTAYFPLNLYSSTIDLSLDSGRGEVVQKNEVIMFDSLSGALSATRHSNGMDWWILEQRKGTNQFITVLLTDSGFSLPRYQTTGHVLSPLNQGWACFSPNGSILANACNNNDLSLYEFDRCTGVINYLESISLHDSISFTFPEFSASGRFLYIVTVWGLYQFDVWSSNISQSQILIARPDTFTIYGFQPGFTLPQRGPDGKIYIAAGYGLPTPHVIDQPDNLGIACNFLPHSIMLPCVNSTVPYFPNYRLGPQAINCDSILLAQIQDVEYENAITVYPNPTTGSFQLSFSNLNDELKEATIFNVEGRQVLKSISTNYFRVEGPSGIYFIRMQMKSGRVVHKRIMLIEK